jgi:hypothetical protein
VRETFDVTHAGTLDVEPARSIGASRAAARVGDALDALFR